jgi:hypothetical protein
MWGCQANAAPPEPDPQYLYQPGDTVRNRFSGEIIGIVIRRIDRDYIDEKGVVHPHLNQGRSDGKHAELGKYPSYLLLGHITGSEFEWTDRNPRLFAKYSRDIKIKYEEWQKNNDKLQNP